MSKELALLLVGRDLAQTRPSVYRGSKDGSIDGWILVMRRYLKQTQLKATLDDQAWTIIGHLEGEAHNYIINNAESERHTPEKVFEFLRLMKEPNRDHIFLRTRRSPWVWMKSPTKLSWVRDWDFWVTSAVVVPMMKSS